MLKIGHRGAPGYPRIAENTIGSFRRAIWKGADALEFDVRRSKDGKLVVIHDLSVQRTTNGSGNVRDLTYEQLRELDAGLGEKIPSLEDVLRIFGTKALLIIEIKEQGIERDVLRMVQFYGLGGQVLISAFDSDDNDQDSNSSWEQLRVLSGRVSVALLARESKIRRIGPSEYVEEAVKMGAFAVNPEDDAVSNDMIYSAHKAGILVNVWTVNLCSRVRDLHELGVDGIFSDCPELL